MKCKVYGCEIKKCFCADEECCLRIDCSECANIANLSISEEIIELAEKAIQSLEARKDENIQEWAERCADSWMKIEEKYGDT